MSDLEEDYMKGETPFNSYCRKLNNSENDSDVEVNSGSDGDYQREKSELELLREKNMKEIDVFLSMLKSDPEYADVVDYAKELKQKKPRRNITSNTDPTFRCSVSKPVDIRRSTRLQNMPPIFCENDLIDNIEINRKRKKCDDYDFYDLETVVYRPRKSRVSTHNTVRTNIIPVEEVTDKMLANIARKGTVKVYSDEGTSCHQCRQKTKDQKSCCRNTNCFGVRGQFCGVCLENRYGEDVAVVLKDPYWHCPVCRGICNCSFCRQKAGKRPTGILAPLAQQNGHKSVKDFLESLKGEGDYAHQDFIWQKMNNPEFLLGYSKDLKFAHMGGSVKHEINYYLKLEKLTKFILKEDSELESIIDLHGQPTLLGFFKDTNNALLSDGTVCYLGPVDIKN